MLYSRPLCEKRVTLNMSLVPALSEINFGVIGKLKWVLTLSEVYPGKSDIANEHSLKSTAITRYRRQKNGGVNVLLAFLELMIQREVQVQTRWQASRVLSETGMKFKF